MTFLLALAWVVGAVYASIPLYWLAVHPFTGFWQRQKGSAYRYLVPFWAIVTGVLLAATYPWFPRQLYRTWIALIPAVALVAASVAIYRRVSSDFRREQVIGQAELQPSRHEQKLITTGMHARIRHPLYLGHLLTLVALAVGSGLIVVYVFTAIAIVTGAIMIRLEERELARRFGDEYRDYQRRVPAILPRPAMKFELYVAVRYLRAKRRQAVISVITAISVAGVALGVASLIVALAINNGFRQELQQRLLGSTAHVNLMRMEADGIRNWRELLETTRRQPHVVANSPALYEQVLISRGARAKGAILKGVLPEYENQASELLKNIKSGSAESLEPAATTVANELPPIVLGREMADELGAVVGSVVLVTSPQGELTPFGIVPKYVRYKVSGIFQSGFYDYDSGWAFVRLADAQRLFGLGDIVSVIEFKLDDLYWAAEIGEKLEEIAGRGFMSTNWMEQSPALFRALRLERIGTFIVIGLIVAVAALNILISLIMMVMEKTRDIAVLVSMGARKRQVQRIFISQGMLIGLLGTLAGLIAGYAFAWAGSHYRLIPLSAEVYSTDYLPFAPRIIDGVIVAVVAIMISFVATIYPSWSAARIAPAEALRYE